MNEVTRGRWASAYCNGDFIHIETWSGYRGMDRRDYKGKSNFLALSASDEDLGFAVLDALAHSRWLLGCPREGFVPPSGLEFDMEQYDYKLTAERNAQWLKLLMERYGYKTKRALFKNFLNCGIESKDGVIKIIPMRRAGAEGWEGLGPNDAGAVEIPADSSPAEIGAALRLAFGRCAE